MLLVLVGCGGALVGPVPDSGRADDYPTPRLASPWAEGVQWVDARGAEAWARGHLPGAVSVPAAELQPFDADGAWDPGETSVLRAGLAARGLRAGVPAVVYGDPESAPAADGYVYAALRALGVEDARLLDGGVAAWLLAGRALETGDPPLGDFVGGDGDPVRATTEEVVAALEAGDTRLVDTRSSAEYAEGHLPGAVSLPWDTLLDDGWLRPADAVAETLAGAGLADPEAPVIVYCAEGVRAGHTLFVLELMGWTDVRDYVGSYSAWTEAGLPVER